MSHLTVVVDSLLSHTHIATTTRADPSNRDSTEKNQEEETTKINKKTFGSKQQALGATATVTVVFVLKIYIFIKLHTLFLGVY